MRCGFAVCQVRQEEGGSAALAPVGAGVGVRLLTCCWEKWECRFCTSRHFLNRLGCGGSIYVEGRVGEAGNLAEEVRVRMCRVQSEVTWGGCRSYSPSHIPDVCTFPPGGGAICRLPGDAASPPPTCRLARHLASLQLRRWAREARVEKLS